MELTDGKLYRVDGTEMTTDERGLITEPADIRWVAHQLAYTVVQLSNLELPMLGGLRVIDLLALTDPMGAMAIVEVVQVIHTHVCDASAEPQKVDLSSELEKQIASLLAQFDKKEE